MSEKQDKAIQKKDEPFLIFHDSEGNLDIPVKMLDETVWLTQDQMATLFHSTRQNIGQHINNIFKDGELQIDSTIKNFFIVQKEGDRDVQREIPHYNLDVIISVGYRVNSRRGTQFRIWATGRLREYILNGYALDEKRLQETGQIDKLLERVRAIRTSEKAMYRKITDILVTSVDYDPESDIAHNFFATIQNKLHYAVHGKTATEVIIDRADSNKPHMGLMSWAGKRDITRADAKIAKNYLDPLELKLLELLGEQFLSFAEFQYTDKKKMCMKDWDRKFDELLELNERRILHGFGLVSRKMMEQYIEEELRQYQKNKKAIMNE